MRPGMAEVSQNQNPSGYLVLLAPDWRHCNTDRERYGVSQLGRPSVRGGERSSSSGRGNSGLEANDSVARVNLFPNRLIREGQRFNHAHHPPQVFVLELVPDAPGSIEKGQPAIPVQANDRFGHRVDNSPGPGRNIRGPPSLEAGRFEVSGSLL